MWLRKAANCRLFWIGLKKLGSIWTFCATTSFWISLHCNMLPDRTVAVDMRGYGDSDKPVGLEDYKMPCLVNDIKEIIEALGTDTTCVRVRAKNFYLLQRKNLCSVRYIVYYSIFFCYLNMMVLVVMWRQMVGPFDHNCFMNSALFIWYQWIT